MYNLNNTLNFRVHSLTSTGEHGNSSNLESTRSTEEEKGCTDGTLNFFSKRLRDDTKKGGERQSKSFFFGSPDLLTSRKEELSMTEGKRKICYEGSELFPFRLGAFQVPRDNLPIEADNSDHSDLKETNEGVDPSITPTTHSGLDRRFSVESHSRNTSKPLSRSQKANHLAPLDAHNSPFTSSEVKCSFSNTFLPSLRSSTPSINERSQSNFDSGAYNYTDSIYGAAYSLQGYSLRFEDDGYTEWCHSAEIASLPSPWVELHDLIPLNGKTEGKNLALSYALPSYTGLQDDQHSYFVFCFQETSLLSDKPSHFLGVAVSICRKSGDGNEEEICRETTIEVLKTSFERAHLLEGILDSTNEKDSRQSKTKTSSQADSDKSATCCLYKISEDGGSGGKLADLVMWDAPSWWYRQKVIMLTSDHVVLFALHFIGRLSQPLIVCAKVTESLRHVIKDVLAGMGENCLEGNQWMNRWKIAKSNWTGPSLWNVPVRALAGANIGIVSYEKNKTEDRHLDNFGSKMDSIVAKCKKEVTKYLPTLRQHDPTDDMSHSNHSDSGVIIPSFLPPEIKGEGVQKQKEKTTRGSKVMLTTRDNSASQSHHDLKESTIQNVVSSDNSPMEPSETRSMSAGLVATTVPPLPKIQSNLKDIIKGGSEGDAVLLPSEDFTSLKTMAEYRKLIIESMSRCSMLSQDIAAKRHILRVDVEKRKQRVKNLWEAYMATLRKVNVLKHEKESIMQTMRQTDELLDDITEQVQVVQEDRVDVVLLRMTNFIDGDQGRGYIQKLCWSALSLLLAGILSTATFVLRIFQTIFKGQSKSVDHSGIKLARPDGSLDYLRELIERRDGHWVNFQAQVLALNALSESETSSEQSMTCLSANEADDCATIDSSEPSSTFHST
eukprot:Ihof_evm2s356 gene=Ihof_evmTU2s356